MHTENRLAFYLTVFATVLALCVVMLGAYTRLKDAGLGCPDWPGCYGHMIAPDTAKQDLSAEKKFPGSIVNEKKAWTEMVHRYFAGTTGILILLITFLIYRNRHLSHQPLFLPLILIAIVLFQVCLGKWTVTMQLLPLVVMSHLLGGMAILSILWLLALRLKKPFAHIPPQNINHFQFWAALGLVIVSGQIFLGGWTSTNYAALICPTFPYCQGHLWPAMNFQHAFNFFMPVGTNYQGGVLGNTARVTIQMMHRLGAAFTGLYLGGLSIALILSSKTRVIKKIAFAILILLALQICLGILNVIWLLPLPIADAHNGVAGLLLLSVVTLNYALAVLGKPKNDLQFSRARFA